MKTEARGFCWASYPHARDPSGRTGPGARRGSARWGGQLAYGLCLVSMLALGCRHFDPSRGKRAAEFARLDSALRRLQEAPNRAKAKPLADLVSAPCKQLCEFQSLCGRAYRMHSEALERVSQARARLNRPSNEPAVIAELLASAEGELKAARPLLADCAAEQGRLQRELGR